MLYIRVELWPFGDKSRATLLGEGRIGNVGLSATPPTSISGPLYNYHATFSQPDDGRAYVRWPEVQVTIQDFPRERYSAFDLLLWALQHAQRRLLHEAAVKKTRELEEQEEWKKRRKKERTNG